MSKTKIWLSVHLKQIRCVAAAAAPGVQISLRCLTSEAAAAEQSLKYLCQSFVNVLAELR